MWCVDNGVPRWEIQKMFREQLLINVNWIFTDEVYVEDFMESHCDKLLSACSEIIEFGSYEKCNEIWT